jgi:hypothetical protein
VKHLLTGVRIVLTVLVAILLTTPALIALFFFELFDLLMERACEGIRRIK